MVANHLKHGMMTVRPAAATARAHQHGAAAAGMAGTPPGADRMAMAGAVAPWPPLPLTTLLSFLALSAGGDDRAGFAAELSGRDLS
jgi:hypothetical protein